MSEYSFYVDARYIAPNSKRKPIDVPVGSVTTAYDYDYWITLRSDA